jgi:ADP-heptose:LPS heptosyltransferase
MPKRQRWTPVRGTRNRIYEPHERLLVAALDVPLNLIVGAGRLLGVGRPGPFALDSVREVLVLRLDRIGDVIMSLPALADLRAALPHARIRLAVGQWSEGVAQSAPVDDVLVWSAPWVGRADEGASSTATLLSKARALRSVPLDLAIDLQGDVRSALLMFASGAERRVGYANSGGRALLTQVVPLDETVSWVEQNRRAVALATGRPPDDAARDPLTQADRDFARRLFERLEIAAPGPLVGLHPSGGRPVKQWPAELWGQVAGRLERELGATFVITGVASDRALAQIATHTLTRASFDLTGKLSVRETLAVIERLDLFLSPDTGTMHMACAVDTPSVTVFGPSDPIRYFSGGHGRSGSRHVVVRAELWCSPCNLIRKPPAECSGPEAPECLRLVTADQVYAEAAKLLAQHRRTSAQVRHPHLQ